MGNGSLFCVESAWSAEVAARNVARRATGRPLGIWCCVIIWRLILEEKIISHGVAEIAERVNILIIWRSQYNLLSHAAVLGHRNLQ
jgi:hypothetical protein